MTYAIYELVSPDFLRITEPDGYYTKTVHRHVLQPLNEPSIVGDCHPTMQSAEEEIKKHSKALTSRSFVILPVMSVNWDGEVY